MAEPASAAALTPIHQYIRDLSFESPQLLAFREAAGPAHEPFSMGVLVGQIAADRFEVALPIRASAYRGGIVGYILEFTYAGIFDLISIPPEHRDATLHIQAPELLFPFARKVLARLMATNGFPFNTSQHADFVRHYGENRANGDRRI